MPKMPELLRAVLAHEIRTAERSRDRAAKRAGAHLESIAVRADAPAREDTDTDDAYRAAVTADELEAAARDAEIAYGAVTVLAKAIEQAYATDWPPADLAEIERTVPGPDRPRTRPRARLDIRDRGDREDDR